MLLFLFSFENLSILRCFQNETKIAEALVTAGPLSIAIDASTLQFYRRGVWDPIFCDPKALDHGKILNFFG